MPAGGAPDSGIGVFSRISGSPSDRNQISFYVDGSTNVYTNATVVSVPFGALKPVPLAAVAGTPITRKGRAWRAFFASSIRHAICSRS